MHILLSLVIGPGYTLLSHKICAFGYQSIWICFPTHVYEQYFLHAFPGKGSEHVPQRYPCPSNYQTLETMNPKETRISPRNPMLGEGKGNFSPAKRPAGSSNNLSDNLTGWDGNPENDESMVVGTTPWPGLLRCSNAWPSEHSSHFRTSDRLEGFSGSLCTFFSMWPLWINLLSLVPTINLALFIGILKTSDWTWPPSSTNFFVNYIVTSKHINSH